MGHHHRAADEQADVDMTPMLDIVFIMLIFFVVTSSFIREQSTAFSRPNATTAAPPDKDLPIHVRISEDGQYWVEQRVVDQRLLLAEFQRAQALQPERQILIEAHHLSPTESMINAVDAAKQSGLNDVAVATF